MTFDLPDSDELAAINAMLPPLSAEEQEDHARALVLNLLVAPARLAPDLMWLKNNIDHVKVRRAVARGIAGYDDPCIAEWIPPFMFQGFEALDSMRGGMGFVIKALDRELGRLVAIKLWLRPDPDGQGKLIAEARSMAKVKHPNVVAVYGTGDWNDRVYFVMEWIDGVDGQKWLTKRRSWREVRRVFIAAGSGLAAAHDAEIHHRDFKPANLMVGNDGRVVVLDFGVAASLHSSPDREEHGRFAGTPQYTAPERLLGMRGDARSDQYSFCASLFRALYGQHPYEGETIPAMLEAMERGEIQEPAGVDVPRWLRDVVRKGLAFDPEDRHRDMHALVAALLDEDASAVDDERDLSVPVLNGRVPHEGGKGAVGAASQRRRWLHFAAGAFSMGVGLMGLTMWTRSPPQEQPAVGTTSAYHAILELVAADEFVEAEEYWRGHMSELSDEESLRIARACLARSKQLDSAVNDDGPTAAENRAKARQAASSAWVVANRVENSGKTSERQKEGGQLAAEARLAGDRPSPD